MVVEIFLTILFPLLYFVEVVLITIGGFSILPIMLFLFLLADSESEGFRFFPVVCIALLTLLIDSWLGMFFGVTLGSLLVAAVVYLVLKRVIPIGVFLSEKIALVASAFIYHLCISGVYSWQFGIALEPRIAAWLMFALVEFGVVTMINYLYRNIFGRGSSSIKV